MGVISDLIANATTIDFGGADSSREAGNKQVNRELRALMERTGDPDYPAALAVTNEVQSIAVHDGADGGTFTLTISLKGLDAFTTDDIDHDETAANIEAAIDTAAGLASVPGFTAGDIACTGGDLTSAPVVLTYSGASVAGQNHGTVAIDGGDLTNGTAGAVTVTTEGQTARSALAVLRHAGVIGGTYPDQGEDPDGLTSLNTRATYPLMISQDTIRALAREATVQDGNAAIETEILRLAGLD